MSDVQDYLEYIIKKREAMTDNPLIKRYINKIESRITFKISTGFYLELLTPEAIKVLGSTKNKITKSRIGENVPHLEITETLLVHFNTVKNYYQRLNTFVPNKSFSQLLDILSKGIYNLKIL